MYDFLARVFHILLLIHGDDFAAATAKEALDKLERYLKEHFELKSLPRIGPLGEGGVSEGHFLKRAIGWSQEGFTWQADPKHAQRIIKETLGDRPVVSREVSPSSKHVGKSCREAAEELEGEERALYRSLAATSLYLAGDRPDMQEAAAILMSALQTPLTIHMLKLQRLAVYLNKHPVLIWDFAYPSSAHPALKPGGEI